MSYTTPITVSFKTPDVLVRGQDTTLYCPIFHEGTGETISSASYEILNSSMQTVLSGACDVEANLAFITINTSLQYGDDYRIKYTIITLGEADGHSNETIIAENELYIVRCKLSPVIASDDLYKRVSGLSPTSSSPHSTLQNYDSYIMEAWHIILNRLIQKGNRPNLILSNTALRECHIQLTLAIIFEDFATRLQPEWETRAISHRQNYEKTFLEINFRYETAETTSKRKAALPSYWLM